MSGPETSGRKNRKRMNSKERETFETRVVKTYRVFHSAREVARMLRTNKDAVIQILRERGEPARIDKAKLRGHPRESTGRIAIWLKKHASLNLPRDYKHLAEVIGVSYGALRAFFSRRRAVARKRIRALPSLENLEGITLESCDGGILLMSNVSSYKYILDRFTLEVYLSVQLKNGEYHICPIPSLEAFAQALKTYPRRV